MSEPIETTLLPAVQEHREIAPTNLFGSCEPVAVIEKAGAIAAALKDVVKRQGLISNISGKEYPRCEAWTLLGTMLGIYPVLLWSKPVEGGWEARVEARTRDGATVGAAEAQCLRSEKNWQNREDFALRSMAQTRATAKALRMPLGFVMTLAGYQPTPAEEMDFEAAKPAHPAPRPVPPPKPAPPPAQETLAEKKARFVAMFEPYGELALNMMIDAGLLLPNESLSDVSVTFIEHLTKAKAHDLLLAVKEQANKAGFTPAVEPKSDSSSANPAPPPANASPVASTGHPEGTEHVIGKIDAVSVKTGTSKKGEWQRVGIKVGEEWFNSFDRKIAAIAQEHKGQDATIFFTRGERGNDIVDIVP